MLSPLLLAALAAQTAEDGFSKVQILIQQLIDWGVSAGGRLIGHHHICGRTVLDISHQEALIPCPGKKTHRCRCPDFC